MSAYIIAYDLGTGGNKASLYDVEGKCIAESFVAYPTLYPRSGWHEQKPEDWWDAVVESTRILIEKANIPVDEIACCGISGHSLGVVPIDKSGNLLRESTPIWSDSRSVVQTKKMFEKINEVEWYSLTGNGFPPPLYSVFKIMWYRDNEPEMFEKTHKVLGTKDFVNLKLTGEIYTDFSYASGSGVYDLVNWEYSHELIEASELKKGIFPEILPSTEVIGTLSQDAAKALGLPENVQVISGGVDNSCMALGACCFKEGRVYNSQGSSSWIAVASSKPLLQNQSRPFVFAHVVPNMFASALGVFSTGTSFRWVRDNLCQDLILQAESQNKSPYDLMTALAVDVNPGSKGLLFNPSMAGGSSLDKSPNIRAAFLGLDLGHSRAEIIRATMEGVALELRKALDELRKMWQLSDEMIVVGGGSRSKLWRQIYADVYNMRIIKTNIDQQAAALGAASLAAVGSGLWKDFVKIDDIHQVQDVCEPIHGNHLIYENILKVSKKVSNYLAEIGDDITAMGL
ncbi:MAG TPA: pentose kinase [Anaerolineae bacterium]|nr:pentose kinase [Anaerolineae bacterium]